jgi:non-homologous end joining protein Ku
VAKEEEAPAKVVNLMEALRKSLESVSEGKKKPAKADLAKIADAKASAPRKQRRA